MAEEEVGLRVTLKDRKQTAQGLTEVKGGLNEVGDAAEEAGRKADRASSAWSRVKSAGAAVGKMALYGAAGVSALGAAAATAGLKTAASMEQAKIGFSTMLGSGQKARKFLGKLASFAAATPFEFPELQTAASSLVSVGIKSKDVIPIMRTLGNVTSGMGTGAEGIQRATVALQQMNAAQAVHAEDLNQLRDAGIPVYDLLSKALGKSKKAVVGLAQKGKLGQDALGKMMKALETGKGLERFNGLMQKQSQSLTGVWSTLKDTVNMGLAKAVKPALPLVKELVLDASNLATKAMPYLHRGVKSAVQAFDELRKGGGPGLMDRIKQAASGIGPKVKTLGPALDQVGNALTGIDWGKLGGGVLAGIRKSLSGFSAILGFVGDHVDLVAKVLPYLVTGFIALKAAQAANNAIGKESLVGFALQLTQNALLIVSTKRLAKAMEERTVAQRSANAVMMESIGATEGQTAAENTGLVTKIRNGVVTVANTAKTIALNVATKAMAAGQWLLNAAMSANPLGLVVLGIAALVTGLVIAYKKSDTFRGIVNGAFKAVAKGATAMWNIIRPVLKLWVDSWLLVVGAIVNGAAKALGWVPGLGGKLKGAAKAFDGFKDDVNKALGGIQETKTVKINLQAVDNSGAGVAKLNAKHSGGFKVAKDAGLPQGATGGVIRRRPGGLNLTAAEGRWDEALVPMNGRRYLIDQTGVTALPTVPPAPVPTVPEFDDAPAPELVGAGAGGRVLHVHVDVDGKTIAEAVLDEFDNKGARQ